MGRYLLALTPEEIIEWSSVVDAPVGWILSPGRACQLFGPERVGRALKHVTSLIDGPRFESVDEAIEGNRAGPAESCLTLSELRAQYKSPASAGAQP